MSENDETLTPDPIPETTPEPAASPAAAKSKPSASDRLINARITHKGSSGDEPLTLVINGHDKLEIPKGSGLHPIPVRFVEFARQSPDSFDVEVGPDEA